MSTHNAAPSATASTPAAMEGWSRRLDLRALAERFGTPLYLFHPATLRANFERWSGLVGDPSRVRYPVKANPSGAVLETLAALGGGADCASGHEILVALRAGIQVSRVIHNTPAPETETALWLLGNGGTVVADSADWLRELAEKLREPGLGPGRLFVRVNPGGLPGYKSVAEFQKYTDHGSASSQFGIPSEEVPGLLAGLGVPVSGLHVHVGTQMDNVDTFVAGLGFLHTLAELIHERTEHRIAHLNLGGGLGIPFHEEQVFPTIEGLAAALRPHLRREFVYEVEPGNSLVGPAMGLLARVAALKQARGRRWAVLDVGTDQLVKFTVARWEHQIVDAGHRPLPREGADGLCGPLCFAGDVFLPATRLDGIAQGDPLLIRHAGAYCEAVASRFNGRRSPSHVLIGDDGEPRLIRKREDLFFEPALQTVPAPRPTDGAAGEPLAPELVRSLHSPYMHTHAAGDAYDVVETRRTGDREYAFRVATRAGVDFVAMPLALRIIGDCAIIAVGHQIGWREKAGPVWATRLTMSCGEIIPAGEEIPCRIRVSALAPSLLPGVSRLGVVHYDLADGRATGVARVVIPSS